MTLRIYADFNSVSGKDREICWCLRYGVTPAHVGRPLDEVAEDLGLHAGMPVTLFYEDPGEEFEVSAVLEEHEGAPRWQARADWKTFRRIRG